MDCVVLLIEVLFLSSCIVVVNLYCGSGDVGG